MSWTLCFLVAVSVSHGMCDDTVLIFCAEFRHLHFINLREGLGYRLILAAAYGGWRLRNQLRILSHTSYGIFKTDWRSTPPNLEWSDRFFRPEHRLETPSDNLASTIDIFIVLGGYWRRKNCVASLLKNLNRLKISCLFKRLRLITLGKEHHIRWCFAEPFHIDVVTWAWHIVILLWVLLSDVNCSVFIHLN